MSQTASRSVQRSTTGSPRTSGEEALGHLQVDDLEERQDQFADACDSERHGSERNLLLMATEERLTVATDRRPDDPRRFTDSGIEIQQVYTEDDLPGHLQPRRPR